jgi:hypothetical protein
MAGRKPLPMQDLAEEVLQWAESLGHPRRGLVGNLLRLNIAVREVAKDVIVGLELHDHPSEAALVEAKLNDIRKQAGSFDLVCHTYGKGLKRPDSGRTQLRKEAAALTNLLLEIERRTAE